MSNINNNFKKWQFFITLIISLSLTIVFSNSIVKADDEPKFGIKPASTNDATNSKGYFELKAQPGEILNDSVLVQNPGNIPVKLQIYPVDATTGQRSGISYLDKADPRKDIGSWIVLEKETIEILPQQQAKISFKLSIPKDAIQGQHLGGIAVQLADSSSAPTNIQNAAGASFGITTLTRALTAVQINVGGNTDIPSLKINGLAIANVDGKLALTLALKNDGTGLIKPKGTVTLTDASAKTVMDTKLALNTFLPQDSIDYPVPGTLPGPGTYKVHASLDFGGNAPAVYDGQIEVKAQPAKAAATTPAATVVANQPAAATANANANTNTGNTASNPAATTVTAANPVASVPVAPVSSDNSGMMMGIVIGVAVMLGLTTLGLGGYILVSRGKKGN